MKCNNCGNELRIGTEQVGIDEKGLPIFHRIGFCDKCMTKYDLDANTNEKGNNKQKKKDSALSIWAAVLALFTCTFIIGLILAIIDLAKNKNDGKRHMGSYFAIIYSVLCLIAFIGMGIGQDKDKETSQPASPIETQEQSNVEDTQQNVDPADNEKAEDAEKDDVSDITNDTSDNVYEIGEMAELNNVQVTMTSYEESAGTEYLTPADGNEFLLVEFEIINNSDSEIPISSVMSFEAYADDYLVNYSLSALMVKDGMTQLDGTIAPGKRLKGFVGYEVPTDWKTAEVYFTEDVWVGNKSVFKIER